MIDFLLTFITAFAASLLGLSGIYITAVLIGTALGVGAAMIRIWQLDNDAADAVETTRLREKEQQLRAIASDLVDALARIEASQRPSKALQERVHQLRAALDALDRLR